MYDTFALHRTAKHILRTHNEPQTRRMEQRPARKPRSVKKNKQRNK
jgi:hypothetical protein